MVMAITLSVIIQMNSVVLFKNGQTLLERLMVPTYLKTKLIPVMTMFDVSNIIGSCIRIENSQDTIPHRYIYSYQHHATFGHHISTHAS